MHVTVFVSSFALLVLTVSDSVSVVVYDKDGNIKQGSTNEQQNIKKEDIKNLLQKIREKLFKSSPPPEHNVQVKWYLVDYQNKELPEVCDDFLKTMKAFVKKVQSKFP